jgi:hypothetical protein
MSITQNPADSAIERARRVEIPDVTAMSLLDAALAYASAGLHVLPVRSGKHPGSLVGKGWPDKSTRDPKLIEAYWNRDDPPGIAIHTGRSGLTFFDLDVDVIPAELAWLRGGIVQHTRRGGLGSDRGHFGFVTGKELFVSGDLTLADGRNVGEVRSGNTVIMLAPSPHPDADTKGGEYRWRASDLGRTIPPLPDEAREYLRPIGTTRAGVCAVEATSGLVAEALADWTGDDRPKALDGLVDSIRTARSGTRNTTRNALRIAGSESRVGFYPLSIAVERIKAAMIESYRQRGELQKFTEYEFSRLVANGVGYALSRSVTEILEEANRDFGDKFTGFRPAFTPIFQAAFKPLFYGIV